MKKLEKEDILKIAVVSVLLIFALIGFGSFTAGFIEGLTGSSQDDNNSENVTTLEDEETSQQDSGGDTADDKEQAMLDILNQEFEGMATFILSDSEKVFLMKFTDAEMSDSVMSMMNGGGIQPFWNEVRTGFESLSGNITDVVGADYGIALMNPSDKTKFILVARDGDILFDGVANVNGQGADSGSGTY